LPRHLEIQIRKGKKETSASPDEEKWDKKKGRIFLSTPRGRRPAGLSSYAVDEQKKNSPRGR